MGNEVVIVQILAVILILFFCFITYMNTKTWRATHVTFMFLVFAAALAFSVYASLILKTRKAWQKITVELEKRDETATLNVKDAMWGKKGDPASPGLAAWREALRRQLIDRGRVWRDCAVVGVERKPPEAGSENATVVVNLRTGPADDPGGAKVDYSKMQQDTVVYAFNDTNPMAPHTAYMYMGEFTATAVTDTSITLTSTSPLTPFDQNVIGDKQVWVLYERMPADDHRVFSQPADTFHVDIAGNPLAVAPSDLLKVENFDEGGTLLKDPQAHQKLFQETLWEYERDGMTEEEMDAHRAAKMQEPLPEELKRERLFAQVKFLKDYEVEVDAGQATPPDSGNADLFDRTGKALDPRLQRGGKVPFKEGETAEMIYYGSRGGDGSVVENGAKELADQGVLNITRTIYRRPLNDYAYAFRHIYARKNQILESLALVNKEIAIVKAEIAAAEKNAMARRDEKTKLLEDQTKLAQERKKIGEYAEELEASYRGVRAELSRLYRENAALHDNILAASEELTREIESRGGTPTALEK